MHYHYRGHIGYPEIIFTLVSVPDELYAVNGHLLSHLFRKIAPLNFLVILINYTKCRIRELLYHLFLPVHETPFHHWQEDHGE